MQDQDIKSISGWQATQLTKYLLFIAASLLLWFLPITHDICQSIDVATFRLLNNSLQYSTLWQAFWGYLNHPNENWLNVIVMISLNILGIFSLPALKRRKAFAGIIYFWLFFQMIMILNHFIFSDLLHIKRLSASLVMTPTVDLSQTLNIPDLKVSCSRCFPAGHALVLIFWAKFSALYNRPWVQKLVLIVMLTLIFPRLFTGAHWLSDIVFTICLALLWFEIAVMVQRLINFIWLKPQADAA